MVIALVVISLIVVLAVVLRWLSPYALLGPLAVLAVGIVLRPALGVLWLVAFVPFNGLISDLLVTAGAAGTATIIGAAKDVALGALVVAALIGGRHRRIPRDLLVLVGAFLVVGAAAAIGSGGIEQAAYGWRNDFMPTLLILVVPLALDERIAGRVVGVLAASMNVASLIAILTWSRGVGWLFTTGQLPVDEGENFPGTFFVDGGDRPRAFSPFSGPNELALAMAIFVAVALCHRRWSWRTRILLSTGPVLALLLSQSRSGLVGLAAVLLILATWYLWRRSRKLAVVFVAVSSVVGAAGAAVYLSRHGGEGGDPSLGGHAQSAGDAIAMVLARPFGYGLGEVGPRAVNYTDDPILVESFWLLLALEAGILALLIFVALLARLVHVSLRAGNVGALTTTAVIGASLVSQLVLPTLQDSSSAYLLWISASIGLFAAGYRRQVQEPSRA